jgi:hypothetical protein
MPDAASERGVQTVSSAAMGLASLKLLTSLGTPMAVLVMAGLSAATVLSGYALCNGEAKLSHKSTLQG